MDQLTQTAIPADTMHGSAALLRGVADMMRAAVDAPTFPEGRFQEDTSARGITRAWADTLDASADQMEQEVSA